MVERHHVVDIGIAGQQLPFDPVYHVVGDARHTLHAGGDAEDVARAHTAVGIAVALEGVALQRFPVSRLARCKRQSIQCRRLGHPQHRFVNPAPARDRLPGEADHLAVTQHRRVPGDVNQRYLVSLRIPFAQLGAVSEQAAGRQAVRADHDGHVVVWIDLDRQAVV